MQLSRLAAEASGQLIGNDIEFKTFSIDTRTLCEGELFIAIKGDNFDGHDFVEKAIAHKACALVVEQAVPNCPLSQLVVTDSIEALGLLAKLFRGSFWGPLVAITGSCGKTSVKGLLLSIFEQEAKTLATLGNFNNQIGVPLTLNRLTSEDEFAVIEMGASQRDDINYLVKIAHPNIALVNNVRASHVSGFGSIEAIANEKGTIYSTLEKHETAVINLDDAFAGQYIAATNHVKQLGFSRCLTSASIDSVFARDIAINDLGQASFSVCYHDEKAFVSLQVLGEHFIDNALAAAACAIAAGINLPLIAKGLGLYQGEKGRMQSVAAFYDAQKAVLVNDAYNANPGSVRAAIDYLAAVSRSIVGRSRKGHSKISVLVLGDMGELGDGETVEHTAIGLYAKEQGIDQLITVGPLSKLASEAFGNNAVALTSLDAALPFVMPLLAESAVILLKGSRFTGMDQLIHLISEKRLSLSKQSISQQASNEAGNPC